MAIAAPRVAVDLFDEFQDGVFAIADDVRRFTARGGDEAVSDHQQAEILAGQVAFNHDLGTDLMGGGVTCQHILAGLNVGGHALALVAITGFDDHRAAEFAGGGPGILGIGDRAALGHRHAGRFQQVFGELLVLGDRFSDGAGAVHFRGLDAPLFAAPAELHQTSFGEPTVGNAAGDGGGDDGAGAGAEPDLLVEFTQPVEGGRQVERQVVEGGHTQFQSQFDRQPADGFLGVLDDYLIDSGIGDGDRAAERDRTARLGLQAEGGQFQRGNQRGAGLK